MTVTYFFFGHLCVFWVYFTSIRVTLELLAINVEKPLLWRLQTRLFFLPSLKRKYFFVWWGPIIESTFDSINKFLENCDQKSLDTRSFSAILSLRLTIVLIIIKLVVQITEKERNFLKEQNASSIFYFFFVLVNRTAWKTPCRKLDLSSISNQC